MNVARTRIGERYRAYRSQIGELPRRMAVEGRTLHSGRNVVKKMAIASPGNAPIEVAVKAFRVPARPRGYVYARLRLSKARRCMVYGRKLLEMGVSTPDPVACIELEEFGCLRESYYVSRYWKPDCDLIALLYKAVSTDLDINALLGHLARFTFLQHEKGVIHSDYNPGNILTRSQEGGFEFSLVDINRLRFKTPDLKDRIDTLIRLTTVVEYLGIIGREYASLYGVGTEGFCRELQRAHLRFRGRRRVMKCMKSLIRHEH